MIKTKEEIIKEIEKEQQKLKDQLKTTNPEIKEFKEYLQKNNFSKPKIYQELDIKEFMINYILSINSNYKREDLTKLVDDMIPAINNLSIHDIESLIDYIGVFNEKDYQVLEAKIDKLLKERDIIIKEIKESKDYDVDHAYFIVKIYFKKWKKFFVNFPDTKELQDMIENADFDNKIEQEIILDELIDKLKDVTDFIYDLLHEKDAFYNLEFNNLLNIISPDYQKYPRTFISVLEKVNIIRVIQTNLIDNIEDIKSELPSIRRQIMESASQELLKRYNYAIKNANTAMRNHLRNLVATEKENNQLAQLNINQYDRLKKALTTEEEITNYRILTDHIKNKELHIDILKYIYAHNSREYEKLNEEYQTLINNDTIKYKLLMKQYNLDNINVDNLINNYSYQELKDTLNSITKITTDEKRISSILRVTNKTIVQEVETLVNDNVLSIETAQSTIELWNKENSYPTTIKDNKKIIEDITNSDDLYKRQDQVLLIPSDNLQTNLTTLKEEKLLPLLYTTTDYRFLGHENLNETLDFIKDLGYQEELIENINLLNYDINRWYRLNILNQLNITVEKDQLEELLHTDNFLIPDDKIQEFVDYSFVTNQEIKKTK